MRIVRVVGIQETVHKFYISGTPLPSREKSVLALFDSDSEVNAIYPTFAQKLALFIRPTDIGAQKIDSIKLNTYRMVVAAFLITDKVNQVSFFEKTFLVANISMKVVLLILFLTLSGTDIDFLDWELQ